MTPATQSITAINKDLPIPQWVKFAITFFSLSIGAIFLLSAVREPATLFGLSTLLVRISSLVLMTLAVAALAAFWLFPSSAFSQSIYVLMRFFRAQICVLALLGIVTLITMGAPLLSLRGGIPLVNLLVLFLLGCFVEPIPPGHLPLGWMQHIDRSVKRLSDRINTLPVLPLRVAAALLPILIVCSLIYLGWNARLSDYGPYSFWNDETGYWVWVRSFGHVGFDAGYNTPNELPAPASFNRYGEGSPIYLYLYGGIAQVVGWVPYLPILINFLILALAIYFFTHLTRLEPTQILFTSLATILSWPVLLYLPMTTHETLNQVIGLVLSVVFFRFLTQPKQISLPARISFVLLVYLAAVIRLSWGLLLIPAIFYAQSGNVLRRVLLSLSMGVGLFLSAVLITNYLVPPTNNSILVNIRESFGQGPHILFDYISFQFSQMFKFKQWNPNIVVMFQMVIILGWNLVRMVRSIQSRLPIASILGSRSVFDIYNVTTLAMAGLLFYIQEGFYRTFAPSLLIVYLLQVTRKDYKFLATLLTINLLFFHSYMTFYAKVGDLAIVRQDFTSQFPEHAQLQPAIEKWIRFEPAAQNPWCNTLLIPLQYYDGRLVLIPPGIGISYIQDVDTLATPLKSKYLLFDTDTYEELAGRLNTRLLESYAIGDLYYNLDSGCDLQQ